MNATQHKTAISLQLANQAIVGLTDTLAQKFELEDELRAELAALKAKYEPKPEPVAAAPAMAAGGER